MPPDAHRVAGPLDPVVRLADHPHRPAVQRELVQLDDRLVAQLQRVQAVPGVDHPGLLGGAHHSRRPGVLARLGQPGVDRPRPRLRVADRVARGQRDPADHPVGDRRLATGGEDHRLVAAQCEVAQRIPPALLVEQGPQPRLVLRGEQFLAPGAAERHIEHEHEEHRTHHVDDGVHPGRYGDHRVEVLGRRDGDHPAERVAEEVPEVGPVETVVRPDQQRADPPADQQSGDEGRRRRPRVGGVALGGELPAPDQQGQHEQAGQRDGEPVEGVLDVVVAVPRERHEQHVHREGQAAQPHVEDPRGPLAPPHDDGQEDREDDRAQARRHQVRGEVLALVVVLHLVAERHREHAHQVEQRQQAQVPDRRGGGPRAPARQKPGPVLGGGCGGRLRLHSGRHSSIPNDQMVGRIRTIGRRAPGDPTPASTSGISTGPPAQAALAGRHPARPAPTGIAPFHGCSPRMRIS